MFSSFLYYFFNFLFINSKLAYQIIQLYTIIFMLFVGQKIKKIREEKKITQEQLAERLNMSQQSYSSLERGETSINLYKLMEIAEQLDTPPENLIQQEAKNIFKNCNQPVGKSFHYNPTFQNFPPELANMYESQIAALKKTVEVQSKLIEHLQK